MIRIRGRVQGVYYRQSTREKAEELGITGRIQNLPDESVEMIATGEEGQLDRLLAWCRVGPPAAEVSSVEVAEIPLQTFEKFRIQRFGSI